MDRRKGFTFIEIIVVVSVMTLLTSFLLLSSKQSREQTTLNTEAFKFLQILFKAKNDTIAVLTDATGQAPCGYGVRINYDYPQSYEMFKYDPPQGTACDPTASGWLTTDYKKVPNMTFTPTAPIILNGGLGDSIEMVLFMPPNPDVYIWFKGNAVPSINTAGKVHFKIPDGRSYGIGVSPAGQLTIASEQ